MNSAGLAAKANCALHLYPQNYGSRYNIIHKWHKHKSIVSCADDLNIVLEIIIV